MDTSPAAHLEHCDTVDPPEHFAASMSTLFILPGHVERLRSLPGSWEMRSLVVVYMYNSKSSNGVILLPRHDSRWFHTGFMRDRRFPEYDKQPNWVELKSCHPRRTRQGLTVSLSHFIALYAYPRGFGLGKARVAHSVPGSREALAPSFSGSWVFGCASGQRPAASVTLRSPRIPTVCQG